MGAPDQEIPDGVELLPAVWASWSINFLDAGAQWNVPGSESDEKAGLLGRVFELVKNLFNGRRVNLKHAAVLG